jgi:hypothetical protein
MLRAFVRLFTSPSPATTRLLLRWMGVVIFVGGLSTAVSIWIPQDRLERQMRAQRTNDLTPGRILGPLSAEDSRRYTHDAELYYGKSGLLMDKTTRWMEGLSEGKPLAWTVGAVSVALAGALFLGAAVYRPERRGASKEK